MLQLVATLPGFLVAFAVAFMGGAVNSVAGGGTLLSFPTLIWLGLPSVTANATNTVALWPGSLGAVWGYRRELRAADSRLFTLVTPSLVGGLLGAALLRLTPTPMFDKLVPLLIGFATCIFMAQEPIQRRFARISLREHSGAAWLTEAMVFQLFVGLYGGYFGAGIGIMMLAALSIMGYTDIHQMNGVKQVLALAINGIASVYFIWVGLVSWPEALVMAAGSVVGGVGGAGIARRIGQKAVRRIVIAIGFGMSVSMMSRL
jgi:uncharacterized membrane protein YfcA